MLNTSTSKPGHLSPLLETPAAHSWAPHVTGFGRVRVNIEGAPSQHGRESGPCGETLTCLAGHYWIGLVGAPILNISSVLMDSRFRPPGTNST